MNALPAERKAINGRTYGRTYYAADFDPVQCYPARNGWGGVALALTLGIIGAALLAVYLP